MPICQALPQLQKSADMSAERLAGRIIVPHPANTQLTVAELRDIIAYIQTMKPR